MSKASVGAKVQYCGHDGWFIADIWEIEGVNVVRANGKVTPSNINRPAQGATHSLSDFPKGGFWRPDLGVFVVPSDQVKLLTERPIKPATNKPKK